MKRSDPTLLVNSHDHTRKPCFMVTSNRWNQAGTSVVRPKHISGGPCPSLAAAAWGCCSSDRLCEPMHGWRSSQQAWARGGGRGGCSSQPANQSPDVKLTDNAASQRDRGQAACGGEAGGSSRACLHGGLRENHRAVERGRRGNEGLSPSRSGGHTLGFLLLLLLA